MLAIIMISDHERINRTSFTNIQLTFSELLSKRKSLSINTLLLLHFQV